MPPVVTFVSDNEDGTLSIPHEILEAADLSAGDAVELAVTKEGIVISARVTSDPSNRDWDLRERRATQDIRAGRLTRFESLDDMLVSLGVNPSG